MYVLDVRQHALCSCDDRQLAGGTVDDVAGPTVNLLIGSVYQLEFALDLLSVVLHQTPDLIENYACDCMHISRASLYVLTIINCIRYCLKF